MRNANTTMGRSHAHLDEWLEHEHLKGYLCLTGSMWGAHPAWGSDPESASYLDNRWAWHQNLGELLNFHGTAHVRNQNVNGLVKKRLAVTLSHADQARLAAVKAVAGGTIEANQYAPAVSRYRMEDKGAFLVLKAGRLFIDSDNLALFEVLDCAQRFYTHIPEPGAAPTDAQIAGQQDEEDNLIPLLTQYRARGPVPHDCLEQIARAGGGPRRGSADVF